MDYAVSIIVLWLALASIPTVWFPVYGLIDDYFAKKAAEMRAARKRR